MNTLPVFRRMVKAIGDKLDPKRTAYRYEIVEFQPGGRFKRDPDVYITKTQMRGPDGPHGDSRLYEMWMGWEWRLISADEFHQLKTIWDGCRATLGLPYVDELGQVANLCE